MTFVKHKNGVHFKSELSDLMIEHRIHTNYINIKLNSLLDFIGGGYFANLIKSIIMDSHYPSTLFWKEIMIGEIYKININWSLIWNLREHIKQ